MLSKYGLLALIMVGICVPGMAYQEEENAREEFTYYDKVNRNIGLEKAQSVLENVLGFNVPQDQIAWASILDVGGATDADGNRLWPPRYQIRYHSKSHPVSEEFCQTQVYYYGAYVESPALYNLESDTWYGFNQGDCTKANQDFPVLHPSSSVRSLDGEEALILLSAVREWVIDPSKLSCEIDSNLCNQIHSILAVSRLKDVYWMKKMNTGMGRLRGSDKEYSSGFCVVLRMESQEVQKVIPEDEMNDEAFQKVLFCVNKFIGENIDSLPPAARYVFTRSFEINFLL